MKFVHVLVEGQTEYEFVSELLNDYFQPKEIRLTAIIIKTKNSIGSKPAYRGGIVSYRKVQSQLMDIIHDSAISLVTTMIDYYQLPTDFPSYNDEQAQIGSLYDKVTYLEMKFAEAINHRKFYPYFSVHEFEALLFTKPEIIAQEIPDVGTDILPKVQNIKTKYPTPEDINLDTPPSKHILDLIPEYRKAQDGILIALEIGVDAMRKECPHFDSWLTKIESLA